MSTIVGEDWSSNAGTSFVDLAFFLVESLGVLDIGIGSSANVGDEEGRLDAGFRLGDLMAFLFLSDSLGGFVSSLDATESMSIKLSSSDCEESSPSCSIGLANLIAGRTTLIRLDESVSGRDSVKDALVRLLAYPFLAGDLLSLL
jgi:hypothetical protein